MDTIEYFYSAHSGFAYLGSKRFMEIAGTAGRRIVHRPFDLNRLLDEIGAPSFRARSEVHRDYFFRREIERWSEYRSAPWIEKRPTFHDNDFTFANRMIIAAVPENGADKLAHTFLEAHWRDDADIENHATLVSLAGRVGLDGEALRAAAGTQAVIGAHDANTADAIARGLFGSPTYFVDGDMFYGQDHLEIVERALKQPFKGTWR